MVVMGDTVEMPFDDIHPCVNTRWNTENVKKCEKPKAEVAVSNGRRNGAATGSFQDEVVFTTWAERQTPPVHFFEQWQLFCTDTTCGPEVPGTNVFGYHDTGHFNAEGAKYITPYACSALHRWGLI